MADAVLSPILSLAKLAYDTCQDATSFQEECVRIGARLMNLMVLLREWSGQIHQAQPSRTSVPGRSVLTTLQGALTRLNLSLQAATTPKSSWSSKVKRFLKSTEALEALRKAEEDLNAILLDFQVHQNSKILQAQETRHSALLRQLGRVEDVLRRLAQERVSGSAQNETKAQAIDAILEEYQVKPFIGATEATASTTDSSTHSTSFTTSTTAGDQGEDNKLIKKEFKALTVQFEKLHCTFGEDQSELLGEGGFSQVFGGKYKGSKVAVKRLKLQAADLVGLTEKERKHHIRRLRSEAVLLARCGVHPNIM